MIGQETLLVTLVRLVNRIPLVASVKQRKRGRPATYPERLFLQATAVSASIGDYDCAASVYSA